MNKDKMNQIYGNVLWTDKPHNFFGLSINFTRYILTDKKLVVIKGFFNIKEDKIDLYRIMDISLSRPLGQRIFGCGTIGLMSKDVNTPLMKLEKIKNPHEVHNLIEETVEQQKKDLGIMGKDIYAAPTVVALDHDKPKCK